MKTILSIFFCGAFTLLGSVQIDGQAAEMDALLKSSTLSYNNGDFDLAIDQAQKAYSIAEENGLKTGMARSLQSVAKALIAKPKRVKSSRKKAEERLTQSLNLLTSASRRSMRITSLTMLKELSELEENHEQAALFQLQINEINDLVAAKEAEQRMAEESSILEEQTTQLAEKSNLLEAKADQLTEKTTVLSERVADLNVEKRRLRQKVQTLNEEQLESELVIALQKNSVDSLAFLAQLDSFRLSQNQLLFDEQAAKLELQNSELELQQSQQNFFLAIMGLLLVLGGAGLFRYLGIQRHNKLLQVKNEIIEEERAKSEKLLLNILPVVVAEELKANGFAKARKYETVTVLFTDFVNFTGIAKSLSAEQLVSLLDNYFKIFDDVITRHKLEKIKTIGDSYMCVGGLPDKTKGKPEDVIHAAMEMQDILNQKRKEAEKNNQPFFEARIGIHTGSLVAGVVGSKKFAFDIWGDTVNIASRAEERSEAGRINVTSTTYELIRDKFQCKSRGMIPIKNRGEIEMYFVEGVA